MRSALEVLVVAAVMSLVTACVQESAGVGAGKVDAPRQFADVDVAASEATAPERTVSEVEGAIAGGHVARCRAGYFSDNTEFHATCSGGDGVEFWLSTFGECRDGTVIVMGHDADCGDHDGFARLMPSDFEPAPEHDDVARCKNGLYTSNTDLSATCSAYGDVDRWLARYAECGDGSLIVLSHEASCSDHDGFGRLMAADFVPTPDPSDIARCENGLYSSNTDLDATCSANGGVAEWLAPFGTCGDGTVISMGVDDCHGHQGFGALLPLDHTPPVTTSPTPADPSAELPATTSPPVTTPVPAPVDGLLALDVLQFIPIAVEHGAGYDRDTFHAWIDGDGDGCNTRAEVLVAESTSLAQVDLSACAVVAGDWYSLYDGAVLTSPADVEIDHVVALKEAWDSGAWEWNVEQRTAFGNDVSDPRTLVAVSSESNQSKVDRDPSNWLPRDPDVCRYIGDWIAIKVRWSLSMDQSEWGRIENLLEGRCAGWTIAAWAPPPVSLVPAVPPPVVSAPRTTAPPPPPPPPPAVTPPANCNPNYDPCVPNDSDVDCAGGTGNGPSYVHGPVRVIGRDVYGLDGNDNDGIGCE